MFTFTLSMLSMTVAGHTPDNSSTGNDVNHAVNQQI